MKTPIGYSYLENKIKEISEENVFGYILSDVDSVGRKIAFDRGSGECFIIFPNKDELIECFIINREREFVRLGEELEAIKEQRLKLNEELRELIQQRNK
jgi:hypothetical protein